jgi:mannose-6-phosphate isomerase-like protein (cupin superfamily)
MKEFYKALKTITKKEAKMTRNVLRGGWIGFLLIILIIPVGVLAQGKELPGFRLFDTGQLISMANPNIDKFYRAEIVNDKMNAKHLNGIFCILPPASTGAKVAYHYHKDRESILFIISGAGNEIVDGNKVPIKAGDVMFILPGVKHTVENNSDKEIRYVEFFTHPPVLADFIEAK